MANVNVRIDPLIKKPAEEVFNHLGITPSTAINLFYIQVIRTNSIPFELKLDVPNKETKKAIKEAKKMEHNPKKQKPFATTRELMEDLLK